jgi:ribosomal protein L29
MYKQASQLKLRFQTSKGQLTVEQLWDLSMTDLSTTIKAMKKVLKKSDDDDLGFLEEDSKVDKVMELAFNILKDVYITKKEAAKAIREAAEIKAHNQKILTLIADKEEESLKGKSIEELKNMLQ